MLQCFLEIKDSRDRRGGLRHEVKWQEEQEVARSVHGGQTVGDLAWRVRNPGHVDRK